MQKKAASLFVVSLVHLVYMVCLVFWLNATNQMNQINQSVPTRSRVSRTPLEEIFIILPRTSGL
jgi:hypothetical protein